MNGEELKAAIREAFGAHGPFAPQDLSECPCPECDDVRADFAGLSSDAVADPVIDRNFDKLPLLSTDALVAFIPRFMLRAIESDAGEPFHEVLEFTTYALLPPSDTATPEHRAWQEARHAALSPRQAGVAIAFLRYSRERDPHTLDEEELQQAVAYWGARS